MSLVVDTSTWLHVVQCIPTYCALNPARHAGRLLIGYGLAKDLSALQLNHPKAVQRDLMAVCKFQSGRAGQAQKLQRLAQQFLGVDIQAAKHCAR